MWRRCGRNGGGWRRVSVRVAAEMAHEQPEEEEWYQPLSFSGQRLGGSPLPSLPSTSGSGSRRIFVVWTRKAWAW